MILQELIGIKKYEDEPIAFILNKWIKDGKIKVKDGSFSFVVIPNDTDFVYKVWSKDAGWWEYLEYIQDHSENPHLVKLKSRIKKIRYTFKRPADFDDVLYVVRVEKLQELTTNLDAYAQVRGLVNYVKRTKHFDLVKAKSFIQNEQYIEPPPDTFIQTVFDVLNSAVISYHDFKPDNVMLRGDTLVITDPYYVPDESVKVTAADLLHGKFYGAFSKTQFKHGK